jgi:GMP synthase (glutamine-hydrolysing)
VDLTVADARGSILVLMHDAAERPEVLGARAEHHGYEVVKVRVDLDAERLPDPRDYDAVIVMGAEESVYDETVSWIAPEVSFVQEAVAADVPVLGVCFGGQLLSHALGGTVSLLAPHRELGWLELETTDEAMVPPGPWLAWHRDEFSIPPGAQILARSDACSHAFSVGPHVGLQFHPEVTPDLLRDWLSDANRRGFGLGAEGDQLLEQAERHSAAAARRGAALFDEFLRRAGLEGNGQDVVQPPSTNNALPVT